MSVLAIDLGKTNCRVTIGDHGAVGPGFPGLADSDGVARALSVVRAAAALIDDERPAGRSNKLGADLVRSHLLRALRLRIIRHRKHAWCRHRLLREI